MKTSAKTFGFDATFQIWLGDTYGLWLTALCIVVDAAVIVWLVKRYA